MRVPQPLPWAPADFKNRVTSRELAIVLVLDQFGRGFLPGVVDHFDAQYPRRFSFGLLEPDKVKERDWFARNFVSPSGPIRRDRAGRVPAGYYLFRHGHVVAHHAPLSAAVGDIGAAPGSSDEGRQAKRIVSWLQAKLEGRATEDEAPGATPPPPPRASQPPPPPNDGPYVVLNVKPTATDEEVRSAYREALKQNHPDRVTHLSPALQNFAKEQTRAILEAWQEIRKRRGLGES